jgi:hypothetical protein
MWNGAVGNTDMAAAFLGVAGVTAALEFLAGAGRGWLVASGTLIGAAAAVKPLAVTLAVPLGLLVVHGRGAGSVLPLVAGIVLTAGPWLARMWLATGNPVFPAFPGLFGSPDAGTAIEAGSRSVPFRTAFPWTVERVVALPFLLTFRASSLAPTADGSMGTYPLLWLPVLIARWRAVGGAERRLLGVAAGYFIGVAAFAPEPRYLLPTWLLLAPVLGAVLAPLAQPGGAATGTERLALGTVLLAGLGYTLLAWLSMFPAQASLDYLTGRLDRDGYLRQTVPALDIFDDVQRLVPPGALVLTDGLSTTYHAKRYLLPSWLPSVRPLFGPSLTRDEADRLLRARDARYFLALSVGRYPLVELGLARPLVSEGGFTLYELALP